MIWTAERPRPAVVRDWPHAWRLAVATVCLGAFMGQLDASIVTLTYGPLQRQYGSGVAGVQWVSLSYLVALVGLLAPVARRSDRRGRKLAYVRGLVLFTVASAACGLAPNLLFLIAARAAQGAGAALIQANSVAIVAAAAPRSRLRAALGVQAAAQGLGLAVGPAAGGLLVSSLGWRWVYAINIPVGLVAMVAAVLFLPRTVERTPSHSPDLLGSVLFALWAAVVLLILSALAGLSLPGWVVLGLVAAGAGGAAGLAVRQRTSRPVLNPMVLNTRGVPRGLAVALFGYAVLFGPLVLVPGVLTSLGASPLMTGLVLTALPAGFVAAATAGGALLPHLWSDDRRTRAGALLSALAIAGMLFAPLDPGWLAVLLAVLGIGLGVLAPANNAAVMRAVAPAVAASAGGLLSMARALGTAVGIAAVTLGTRAGGPRAAVALLLGASVALLVSIPSGFGLVSIPSGLGWFRSLRGWLRSDPSSGL